MDKIKAFILTGEWQDINGRNVLKFIGIDEKSAPVEIIITNVKPVFFIKRSDIETGLKVAFRRKPVKLKNFDGEDVDAVYFNSERDLKIAAEDLDNNGIRNYEADVDPVRRYLMERFLNAQIMITGKPVKDGRLTRFTNPKIEVCDFSPELKVASIDIETGSGNTLLYSIAANVTNGENAEQKVFIVGEEKDTELISFFPDEKELLQSFISWFKEKDPDIITGWHVIGFDLMFLESKCNELYIPFEIARGNGRVSLRSRKGGGSAVHRRSPAPC